MTTPVDPSVPADPTIPAPVPDPPPTGADVAALAAQFQTMITASQADDLRVSKGVITASNPTAAPPNVSLTLSGSAVVVAGVQYIDSYSPVVGDTALVLKQGADVFVLGQMNDSGTGAAQGWTTIPSLGSGFSVNGQAQYRLVNDNGDLKIQWRGLLNISGTPTAVCTMPSGAIPSVNRPVCAATSSAPATLYFNSSGAVVFASAVSGGAVTGTSDEANGNANASSGSAGGGGSATSTDTQSTVTHSHGGAVASTTITHDDGFHSHSISTNSHTHTIGHTHPPGSYTSPSTAAPTYVSLNGIEYYL